jgi:hypothetical protein
MSTITVTNIQATGETASRSVSGVAAAWVNFNGTGTIAIRDSVNVASLTDNGTGETTVNLTNSMSNANYSGYYYTNATATGIGASNYNNNYAGGFGGFATNSFGTTSYGNNTIDATLNYCGLLGDLA